jgi:hypothetical protein
MISFVFFFIMNANAEDVQEHIEALLQTLYELMTTVEDFHSDSQAVLNSKMYLFHFILCFEGSERNGYS